MASFAYLRVSTLGQAESGAGLAAQEDACRRLAGTLDGVFQDAGVSGGVGLERRPGLLAAITQLGRGDTLLVAKRDRLGRDPLVLAMIESAVKRKGGRIVSAAGEGTDSDEPSAILMRRLIDAFGEYERLIIGARTKAALGAKRARGERTGAIPYGFRLAPGGKRLEADPTEQMTLALVQELRAGGASLRAIGRALTARGLRSRGGSAWHPQTINNLCRAPDAAQPG